MTRARVQVIHVQVQLFTNRQEFARDRMCGNDSTHRLHLHCLKGRSILPWLNLQYGMTRLVCGEEGKGQGCTPVVGMPCARLVGHVKPQTSLLLADMHAVQQVGGHSATE